MVLLKTVNFCDIALYRRYPIWDHRCGSEEQGMIRRKLISLIRKHIWEATKTPIAYPQSISIGSSIWLLKMEELRQQKSDLVCGRLT